MAKTITHSYAALRWIEAEMKSRGVDDYRFCTENDCYVCDRAGDFFSVCKRQMSKSGNFIEHYRIKPLSGSNDKYGYRTYRIVVNGKKLHLKGHRMMLNAWIGEEPDMSVNHKDGNKQNNALENLEWCTVAENNAHAIRTGLASPHKPNFKNRTIPGADYMQIYILNKHCGFSQCELARMNHCSHSCIGAIIGRVERVLGGI